MKETIVKFSKKIASMHERFFTYLAKKSKTSFLFTLILIFMALYEIVEHFIIPALLIWWGIKNG